MVKANGYAADLTLAEDSADQGKQVAQATDVVRSTEPERPTELNSRRNAHASGPEDSMRLYERQCMRWRDKELLHTVVR
jgi:nucleoid-associated protein YgaU